MWLKEFNRYYSKIENFAYGEMNERNFSNPRPRCDRICHLYKAIKNLSLL